jgi:hypothetical protein
MKTNLQNLIDQAQAMTDRLKAKGWTPSHFALAIKIMGTVPPERIEAEVEKRLANKTLVPLQ